ncbi:MAG: signal peptidase II [Spirochaetales bacterium]|nr:signal peptidase II [Spirochaetales bacterium]
MIRGKKRQAPTLIPFIMSAGIIVLDQITKLLIVRNIEPNNIGARILGDFIWIVHAQNLGMAFSMGDSFPLVARRILFIVLPLIVMVFVVIYYLRGSDLSLGMRWVMAGILGGGIGNLIDRIMRPDGVVDFLSLKFYGIFGMERFPAFNVADSCITVGGILLVVLFIVQEIHSREQKG